MFLRVDMNTIFKENEIVYIVENALRVTRVRVVKVSAGRCQIVFPDGKAARIPASRLYRTQEEAEQHVRSLKKTASPVGGAATDTDGDVVGDPHKYEYRQIRRL